MLYEPAPEGMRWQCQRCTACCRWPGDVRISDDETAAIASHVGLPLDAFIQTFTRLRTDRAGLSLIEKPDHSCIFLEGNSCAIQPVKPRQCQGFPNEWNFAGWRKECEAIAVPVSSGEAVPEIG